VKITRLEGSTLSKESATTAPGRRKMMAEASPFLSNWQKKPTFTVHNNEKPK